MRRNLKTILYFSKNIWMVVGIVLVWRGIWYVLDWLDYSLFGGNHIFSSIGGIVLGLLILYLPDKDLKEIERL